MDVIIRGHKKNPDLHFFDDRLVCGEDAYPYIHISNIWVNPFLGATVDITYKGKHKGFKIDKADFDKALKAVAEVIGMLKEAFLTGAESLQTMKDPLEIFEFCKSHSLTELGAFSGWFCERMKIIMDMFEEDEKLLLAFETACQLMIGTDKEAKGYAGGAGVPFVGAITNKRIIFFTKSTLNTTERIIPREQISAIGFIQEGLSHTIIISADLNSAAIQNLVTEEKDNIKAILEKNGYI